MTGPLLSVAIERWPLAQPFVIARGAKTEAVVVTVTLRAEGCEGRGECVPYARYGETPEATAATLDAFGVPQSRADLIQRLAPGAARNALDCALWDLEAKRGGTTVAALIGQHEPRAVETCYTLSLGSPTAMAEAARAVPHLKLLKLKLGGEGDPERMAAVRHARPDARLVADANEAWTPAMLHPFLEAARAAVVELIEQPLPAGADDALKGHRAVPVCADESAHTCADIAGLTDRYDAVNIKLDKTGGLTEALAMAKAARAAGLGIMVGSMVSTSLAVAPALQLCRFATWVDLDGPLLLARDRANGVSVENGIIAPPSARLWG